MIREGSSTYFVLINTLKIPIQAWLASIKFIAGRNYSPISINDLFSFVLLMVATIVYNDKKEISKKKYNNSATISLEESVEEPLYNILSE